MAGPHEKPPPTKVPLNLARPMPTVPKIVVGPTETKRPARVYLENVLHDAIERGNVETVRKLVARGADLNARVDGLSPYELAVWKHGENGEITKLLGKRKT